MGAEKTANKVALTTNQNLSSSLEELENLLKGKKWQTSGAILQYFVCTMLTVLEGRILEDVAVKVSKLEEDTRVNPTTLATHTEAITDEYASMQKGSPDASDPRSLTAYSLETILLYLRNT